MIRFTFKMTLIYFLIINHLSSQNSQVYFRNFSTNEGLPSPEIYCAFQDSKGFIWFGTDNGVSRFDGYQFQNYGPSEGLLQSVVFDIVEDKYGKIWFGTMTNDIFIFDDGLIIPYKYQHEINKYKSIGSEGSQIIVDSNMNLYLVMRNVGFLKVDSLAKSQLFQSQKLNSLIVLHKEKKTIYTHKRSAGSHLKQPVHLEYIEENSTQSIIIDTIQNTNRNWIVYSAYKIPNGPLLITGNESIIITNKNMTFFKYKFPANGACIIQDRKFNIWIGMRNELGIRKYKGVDDLVNDNYHSYLEDLSINSVTMDNFGGIWVTTQQNGIYYAPDLNTEIYNEAFGFPSNFVSAVSFKNENQIYVGFSNGSILFTDILNSRNDILNRPKKNSTNFIYDLHYDKLSKILWSDKYFYDGSEWSGVLFYNKKAVEVNNKKYFQNKNNEYLWTIGRHIYKVQRVNPVIEDDLIRLYESPKRTFTILEDHEDRIWIGNIDGLYEARNDTLLPPRVVHSSLKARIEDLDILPSGELVIGTKGGGILIWDQNKDIVITTTSDNGLVSDMIEDVHVDEHGVIWVATLSGCSKIVYDTISKSVSVRSFSINNGLPSNEVYQIKSNDGQVWMCTAGGLVKWKDPPVNSHSKAPILKDVLVNGFANNQRNSYAYYDNNLEFEFLSINFRQNGKIPYRYKIQSNDDWSHTQNLSVNYPKLPPGYYQFEVQSQNEDKKWSESTKHPFQILKPWWNQIWFLFVVGCILIAIAFILYKRQLQRINSKNEIEKEINKLKQSALLAQMNPHFIFNCLNSVQSFINNQESKLANLYLVSFARLVRGCLMASNKEKISLSDEIQILQDYLELEKMRFSNRFSYGFDIDPSLDTDAVRVPPMITQPFVENSIHHGFNSMQEEGQIKVDIRPEGELLLITIVDNGVGFNAFKLNESLKHTGLHKSLGIKIMQRRLQLLDLNTKENALSIQELISDVGKVLGTKVEIRLKMT